MPQGYLSEPRLSDSDPVNTGYQTLVDAASAYLSDEGLGRLDKAFIFGRDAHDGQRRDSGEPYFTHPLAVAILLADMKLDADTLITALLHDTVEDCDVSLAEIGKKFGEEVVELVNGVTKLSQIELKSIDTKQAENFRKFVLAVGRDIRVLLVKLADRTHNMQTLNAVQKDERRWRIANETMEIYAPLAERMGITRFQQELEDLAFQELQPELRESIVSRLEFLALETEQIVPDICAELHALIQKHDILCEVTGRRKTPYSISRKMIAKNITMEQLADVMAFRIMVPDTAACYQTLGILHTHFPVVMGRFKDYISTPKANGYQSLHTGVIGPLKQKIEIQIRTATMDDKAERGVAAHWSYKQGSRGGDGEQVQKLETFRWARELLSLLELNDEPTEFLENTKLEMYKDQVFCFTPKGDLIGLPKGATAIDFAYAVHTVVGDKCVGVMINEKRRQLTTELVNGDQVKVLTDKDAKPKSEWEDYAVTGRAKSAIKRFIRMEKQNEFGRVGKALLEREYRFRKTPFDEQVIISALSAFKLATIEEVYVHIAEQRIKTREVFEQLHPEMALANGRDKTGRKRSADALPQPVFSMDSSFEGLAVHLGKCCHPLPGDRIVGIATTGKGITVHTKSCSTLTKFVEIPELWLEVEWPRNNLARHGGCIRAVILNEPGALAALCTVIGQQAGNITQIQLTERNLNFFTFILDIDVKNLEHIQSIVSVLRSNKYIESVDRHSL
ncbi:MAG: RelA/SpoT family protein [Candidatus Puniceispirillaceae bacterium]